MKYHGDFGFRRLVAGRASVRELAAYVREQTAAGVAADRAEVDAARKAARRRPAAKPVLPTPAPTEPKRGRAGIPSRPWTNDELRQLRELHAQKLNDGEIGARIGRSLQSVWFKRSTLERPANPRRRKRPVAS